MPSLHYHLDHLHVYCSDVEATEKWFLTVGAELIERQEAAGVRSSRLSLGGAPILIRSARAGEQLAAPGPRHFGADHFGLKVDDVDGTIAELRRRGVTIDVEPRDFNPTMRIAFIRGPDDVRIELVQRR